MKYIRGENGAKIPASYRSGRFDAWRQAHKSEFRVGSVESNPAGSFRGVGSNVATDANGRPVYKHNKTLAPKPADKARDDYHKQRKRVKAAVEKGVRVKGKQPIYNADSEIQSADQVRKAREIKESEEKRMPVQVRNERRNFLVKLHACKFSINIFSVLIYIFHYHL